MGIVVPLRAEVLRAVEVLRGGNNRPMPAASGAFRRERRRLAAFNAPLECLEGDALAAHFHAWRGNAGKRYVCSVFPATTSGELGGLPEFDAAVVLAVGFTAHGRRTRINVFELSWREGRFTGDLKYVSAALQAGVNEWHIHLLAESAGARQTMIDDLKG